MTRVTSAVTYADLEERGVLRGQRLEVLRAFERFGPGTSAEVLKKAALAGNLNLARARVTELANAGMLQEKDQRKCAVTGRLAIEWAAGGPGEPRPRSVRVDLSVDDVQAIADFQSGKTSQFSDNLKRAHDKVLASFERQQGEKADA